MTTTRPQPPDPVTFTVRSTEDLLALVPITLGFEPTDSLLLLTFGGVHPFHARVDLPAREHVGEVVRQLMEPVRRQRPALAAVVCFSADGPASRLAARELADALRGAGIRIVDLVRAHDQRWYSLVPHSRVPDHGVPYDSSSHPYRAEAVVEGRVVHRSRDELAASLTSDPAQQDAVDRHVTDHVCPPGQAVRDVARHLDEGRFPDDVLARLLVGIRVTPVRDAVWSPITREDARRHVLLWTDAVRRAPDRLVPAAAAVLAMAAWRAGDGALAWCAVDRCREEQPDHRLATVVADLLTAAVPPSDGWAPEVSAAG